MESGLSKFFEKMASCDIFWRILPFRIFVQSRHMIFYFKLEIFYEEKW